MSSPTRSMRISELSARSHTSLPTIKFYLREGLLPPGQPTASNQALYTDEHLRRLRLIRILATIGELKLDAIKDILAAMKNDQRPLADVMRLAHHALGPHLPGHDANDAAFQQARTEVEQLLAHLGWHVSTQAPAIAALAQVLVALRQLDPCYRVPADTLFLPYAQIADTLAAQELAFSPARHNGSPSDLIEFIVTGTVLFEQVLNAFRRLAQEHHALPPTAAEPPA